MTKITVITLDGPSGTGKGTACHLLAQKLGFNFLDSGSIYRVLALAGKQIGLAADDLTAWGNLAVQLDLHFAVGPDFISLVYLDGQEVSADIRTEECGQEASRVACIPSIRSALLDRQRSFAQQPGLVTDGRDMGTVVFPEAQLKFYLDASAQTRANRRYLQLIKMGKHASLSQVIHELSERDARDMGREYAPLCAAIDAIHIDTNGLGVMQVFQELWKHVVERGLGGS